MKMTMTLSERIYEYLKKKGDGNWQTKTVLIREAKRAGFLEEDIKTAFHILDEKLDIGRTYRDGIMKYCWYDIPQSERLQKTRAMNWFNSLE